MNSAFRPRWLASSEVISPPSSRKKQNGFPFQIKLLLNKFITSTLKSLVILAIWLALSSVIYSQIAWFFVLNRIFFSANENETVKQNKQSDFKAFLTNQSHCRKMKGHCLANLASFVLVVHVFRTKLCYFKIDVIKWQLNFGSCNFGLKSYLWFQIKLALCARSILKSRVWFLTKLHSTQFNYHYKVALWSASYSACVVYIKTIIHLSVGESGAEIFASTSVNNC